jgi:hypothetical protein
MRTRVEIGGLEIDIDEDRDVVYIIDLSQINMLGSACSIPSSAIYFRGFIDQFGAMLVKMKQKYGHLYGRKHEIL